MVDKIKSKGEEFEKGMIFHKASYYFDPFGGWEIFISIKEDFLPEEKLKEFERSMNELIKNKEYNNSIFKIENTTKDGYKLRELSINFKAEDDFRKPSDFLDEIREIIQKLNNNDSK